MTSYGYALCLELDGQTILFELQRSLEQLVCRMEARLLTQGWQTASAD